VREGRGRRTPRRTKNGDDESCLSNRGSLTTESEMKPTPVPRLRPPLEGGTEQASTTAAPESCATGRVRNCRPQTRFVLGRSHVPAHPDRVREPSSRTPDAGLFYRRIPPRSDSPQALRGAKNQPPSADSPHSNRKASAPVKSRQNHRIFPSDYIHLSAFRLWKTASRWSKSYRMVKRGHPRGRGRFSIP